MIKEKLSKICDIKIKYREKEVIVKALVDSGNLLKDPISKLPVIIVEKKKLIGIVDEFILENIDNILNGKWLEEENSSDIKHSFVLIPFRSLGNEHGLLIGFKPDTIQLHIDDDYLKRDAVVGIYQGSLSGKSNEYNAIIGL